MNEGCEKSEQKLADENAKNDKRQRKKKLVNSVLELFNFYFSVAHISKSRYMKSLINSQNDFIDLEVFLNFNKIKGLTNDIKILKKAVKKCEILEVTEDGLKVKRKIPFQEKNDEMDCTIYIENLPLDCSRDYLKNIFSVHGKIDYISMPKFSKSGKSKGFAFLEFSTPGEAIKALEAFNGGVATFDGNLSPADLLSIKTYGEEECPLNQGINEKELNTESKSVNNDKKRSSNQAFNQESDIKLEVKRQKLVEKINKNDKAMTTDFEETKSHKKKRKRKKKDKDHEYDQMFLRVMSKRQWKKLRNDYLNLQRKNMKDLKKYMHQNKYQNQINNFEETYEEVGNVTEKSIDKDVSTKPEFTPNLIAKMIVKMAPYDCKSFRLGLSKENPDIAYIDIKENATDIFIRFKNEESCGKFINSHENTSLLHGVEENNYWELLHESWSKKRSKKKNLSNDMDISVGCKNRMRGKDKLTSKAKRFSPPPEISDT